LWAKTVEILTTFWETQNSMFERVLTQSPDLGSSKEQKSKKDLKITKKKAE